MLQSAWSGAMVTWHERRKKTKQTEEGVEDNIKEWTGLDFAKSQRAVKNREK